MTHGDTNNLEGLSLFMGGLTVDTLRRSSPLHPSRTLRISEVEAQASTTVILDTSRRPRSNPRVRTPMRYESPLDPDEFRRRPEEDNRMGLSAGHPVGAMTNRIPEERPAKSRKQGPSHRKIRRWNNDKFHRIAHELKGTKAADVLMQGEAEHRYRTILDPELHQSKQLTRFLQDKTLQNVRDRFFEGEFATMRVPQKVHPTPADSPKQWMKRIDSRLRPIIIKACSNSYPATCVVRVLEEFLVEQYYDTPSKPLPLDWWHDLLVKAPELAQVNDKRVVEFSFPVDSSQGGFHRLLLHAVAQFHGLHVVSRLIPNQARFLSVSGYIDAEGPVFSLLDHLERCDVSS
ncbi:hypothetical protein FisN_6Lh186 [Fistulifera solaris]|uniref:R3H-associated N-terminal domain-containing protein n=1 Tax=Fistulifera solaris TaxID=1519565 RepID=A0A1Z5J6J2_FISSO|nr:hypothetical protein FisN_6Lh186 [Fistulifera solaris]|eukprot:GAX09438.1 hypothetical protein FisN_6Lh186 [Fistulifera solaris]